MSTPITALKDATEGVLRYLADGIGLDEGKTATLGTELPDDREGIMLVIISGGPTQEQLFNQTSRANLEPWLQFATVLYQHTSIDNTYDFVGKTYALLNAVLETQAVIIEPNITHLRVYSAPEVFERLIFDADGGVEVRYWATRLIFEVVYRNTQE